MIQVAKPPPSGMTCPKCGFKSTSDVACDACGVNFDRIRTREESAVLTKDAIPKRKQANSNPEDRALRRRVLLALVVFTIAVVILNFAEQFLNRPPTRGDVIVQEVIMLYEAQKALELPGDERQLTYARMLKRAQRLERQALIIPVSDIEELRTRHIALVDATSSFTQLLTHLSDKSTSSPDSNSVVTELSLIGEQLNFARYGNKDASFSTNEIMLNSSSFVNEVILQREPYWVIFLEPDCLECLEFSDNVANVAAEVDSHFQLASVDMLAEPRLSERYSAFTHPTSLLFRNGRLRHTVEGAESTTTIRMMTHKYLE